MPYKILLLIIVFIVNNFKLEGQTLYQVSGTRFSLELPEDFVKDKDILGFKSLKDSSLIGIYEVTNPYTFEELTAKQLTNIVKTGHDTFNVYKSNIYGYSSVQLYYREGNLNNHGFILLFGSDDFLVRITIESSKNRLEELIQTVLKTGNYDEYLILDPDLLLGFKVDYEGSNHKIISKNANTLNTKEENENGDIVSWLNLTRMPKITFNDLSDDASASTMKAYYFPKSVFQAHENLKIDGANLKLYIFKLDHDFYSEYNIIGLVRKDDFDLLIMGAVNSTERMLFLYKILDSIKFN
jgi:hypothetical protein